MLQALQSDAGIIHITDRPVELGAVSIKVDGAARHLHARYHSAGHLIACAGEKYGWLGFKGNHRPGESRVIFDPTDHARPVTEEMLQAEVAALVAHNLSRKIDSAEGRRLVTWGELPATACGGTHVASTGEVGDIRIVRVKQKKAQLSVQYELDGS
jgi:Ser-tRNA(Ala) deacylase AlaX